MDIYSVCEIHLWPDTKGLDFTSRNYLFDADPGKYELLAFRIASDTSGSYSFWDGSEFGRNIAIFVAEMSSSVHIHNKRKDVLIIGKRLTDRLDNTTLTKYFIDFNQQKKYCSSRYYNQVNSYVFVSGVQICKFKANDSETNGAPLC